MALIYPQIMYGFSITAGVNDVIKFTENNVAGQVATLRAGIYYPDSFATEVARALNNPTSGGPGSGTVTCKFNYSNATVTDNAVTVASLGFGIHSGGIANFILQFSLNATGNPANLLGFNADQDNGGQANALTYAGSAVGTSFAGAHKNGQQSSVWTLNEPVQMFTPISAVAAGYGVAASQALLLGRDVGVMVNKSDGGNVETVFLRNLRTYKMQFNQLKGANESPNEQTNMEAFLDWAMKGQGFSYQPDKTLTNVAHFILDMSRPQLLNKFTWVTRDEADYGELTFVEQL